MKKTLIVLVAALAVLGLILMKRGSQHKSMREDVPALDSAGVRSQLKTLRIAKKPDTAVLEFKDGRWYVKKDAFPVDTAKIGRALGHLLGLKSKEKVSQSAARLGEYGLDSVEAKHLALLDGSGKPLAEFMIGKTSGADYSSTYWKWEAKPEVYRTPGNFSYELGAKEEEWKDRKLFGFTAGDIKFLEVSWKDTTGAPFAYKLEMRPDSSWKMLQPVDSNRVAKSPAMDAATRFVDMGIDEFVQPADTNVAKAQGDSATVWAKVTLKDGKSYELSAGKPYDSYYYVKHPTRTETIKLSTWRFDSFKKKPFELLEAPPPPKDTTAASATPAAPAAPPAGHSAGDGHGH